MWLVVKVCGPQQTGCLCRWGYMHFVQLSTECQETNGSSIFLYRVLILSSMWFGSFSMRDLVNLSVTESAL